MTEIIAGVLLCFFAVIGVAELLRGIKKYLLSPRYKKAVLVLSCEGHDEQIEYYVRSLADRADEMRYAGAPNIVIVDAGMDAETRTICERLQCDLTGVSLCKTGELPLLLGQLQN